MARTRPALPAEALATAALDGALRVRRGERLVVESWNHALPWARALVVGAHRRGVTPTLLLRDEPAYFEALAGVGGFALASAWERERWQADAAVRLDGPEAFPRLLGLPTSQLDRLLRRTAPRSPRTRTLRLRISDVTAVAAARLGVDLDRWQEEVVRASEVDPRRLRSAGRRLSRLLHAGREIRISHTNGTDLSFQLSRRSSWVESGVPAPGTTADLPAGRWVAPLAAGSATGEFETNRPAYDRYAEEPVALHGRLEFGDGRLRGFEEDRASQAFAAFVRTGKGRVRPLALSIGLNPEVRRAPELLDLAEGTLSLIVGDPAPSSKRRAPRFVFAASLADAALSVDGRFVGPPGPPAPRARRLRHRVGPRAR